VGVPVPGVRAPAPSSAQGPGAFAVLELFTSEGCSSCPPADALLARLASERGDVYVLSFHVDYWNGLGWADPFSRAEFSARQRKYAARVSDGRVYTPQIVVNGGAEAVGSRESSVRSVLARALSGSGRVPLALGATHDERHVQVQAKSGDVPKTTRLLLALAQKHATTQVSRGENSGHALHHVNVVRSLTTTTPNGTTTLDLPDGLRAPKLRVIGFLQDPTTLQIHGATAIDL